jgi:hypothetical protein
VTESMPSNLEIKLLRDRDRKDITPYQRLKMAKDAALGRLSSLCILNTHAHGPFIVSSRLHCVLSLGANNNGWPQECNGCTK